jgi:ankyrin repeat protein
MEEENINSLLFDFCKNDKYQELKELLENNKEINLNIKNYLEITPLHYACFNNSPECLNLLLN